MNLLHNLRRCVHRNKNTIEGLAAVFAAAAVLILCVVAIYMGKDAVETEASGVSRSDMVPSVIMSSDVPETDQEPVWTPDPAEVEAIARTLYAECRGVTSVAEQAAVAWCILNRVDDPGYPDTVLGVLEQPYQFVYRADAPVLPELEALAMDVLTRYHREKSGEPSVGRTLPAEYLFFDGDGSRNWFTTEWKSDAYWDWSLPDPYAGELHEQS